MRHSVLQNLIVEKLQATSASEAGIKISDEDVKHSLENLAQDNGMTLAQLMDKFKEMGIKNNSSIYCNIRMVKQLTTIELEEWSSS